MIVNKYTPNGISIIQIKKYAKKLKKETNISFQQALDKVVKEKTSFQSWSEMKAFCDAQGGSIAKLKINNDNIVIYKEKNAVYAHYETGMAGLNKSLNMLLDNNFKNILFVEKYLAIAENNNKVFKNIIDGVNISSTHISKNKDILQSEILNSDAIVLQNIDLYNSNIQLEKVLSYAKENNTIVLLISYGEPSLMDKEKNKSFVLKHSNIFIAKKPVRNKEINPFFAKELNYSIE